MITWFTGNSGAGKTTAAQVRAAEAASVGISAVVLDGDELRAVWPGLGLDAESRREQCRRVARLAWLLAEQGIEVYVAVIAPFRDLRAECDALAPGIRWVYVRGGREPSEHYPYEPPLPGDGYEVVDGNLAGVPA